MFKKILAVAILLCATATMAATEVNKASEAELDGLKGIGPATTTRILAERKKSDFKNWEDLMARVKGIGKSSATKLSEQGLTVGGQAYKPTMAAVATKAKTEKQPQKEASKQ